MGRAPLEVPPLARGKCTEPGCTRDATVKGMCGPHYSRKRRKEKAGLTDESPRRETKPVSENRLEEPEEVEEEAKVSITRKEVESAIVLTMGTLATFVDESFAVTDPKTHELLPHANKAIDDMMPWMEIYAPSLARFSPWLGLGMGVFALAMPAYGPTLEIIAGVRKPRFSRTSPTDVYTDEYKAAVARHDEKSNKPAAEKIVSVK